MTQCFRSLWVHSQKCSRWITLSYLEEAPYGFYGGCTSLPSAQSARVFPFLPLVASIYFLSVLATLTAVGLPSLRFWCAYLQGSVWSDTFSCACWPVVWGQVPSEDGGSGSLLLPSRGVAPLRPPLPWPPPPPSPVLTEASLPSPWEVPTQPCCHVPSAVFSDIFFLCLFD